MNPLNLEAKKDGLQQRQDGTWTLKLTVNGEDMQNAVDLLKAPMGQRYMVAMVALDEDDEETAHRALEKAAHRQNKLPGNAAKPKRHWNDLSRAEQAGILCADERFQEFLLDTLGYAVNPGDAEAAAKAVREHCYVTSRKDLDQYTTAAATWDHLVAQYRQETGQEAELR